jgi:hypothetical protein
MNRFCLTAPQPCFVDTRNRSLRNGKGLHPIGKQDASGQVTLSMHQMVILVLNSRRNETSHDHNRR